MNRNYYSDYASDIFVVQRIKSRYMHHFGFGFCAATSASEMRI